MKKDIESKEDIIQLVNSFYEKVISDDIIGFIFTDIVKMNWETHLPLMYDFWENALFYTGSYKGNPMNLHQHLHHIRPLDTKHFAQWILLFTSTVDELFEGEKAILAKQRATSIATIMQEKILQCRIDKEAIY